jgi:hypothetical protein
MKHLTIHGIPYDHSDTNLYIYGTDKTIQIGSLNANASASLTLNPSWKDDPAITAYLTQYRKTLKDATAVALAKAAELQAAKN